MTNKTNNEQKLSTIKYVRYLNCTVFVVGPGGLVIVVQKVLQNAGDVSADCLKGQNNSATGQPEHIFNFTDWNIPIGQIN